MKSKLLILVACMLLVGMAAPAMAAQEPVGERFNLFAGEPDTYPADEPFFVIHGWGVIPSVDNPPGHFNFTLDVDGVDLGAGKLINGGVAGPDGALTRLFLYNFDDGMPAGEYTFTGHWWGPCDWAVEWGMWFEACPQKNAMVEIFAVDHTVTFY